MHLRRLPDGVVLPHAPQWRRKGSQTRLPCPRSGEHVHLAGASSAPKAPPQSMAWLDEEAVMQQMPRPSPVYQRACDDGHALDVTAVGPNMADALLGTIGHAWLTSV